MSSVEGILAVPGLAETSAEFRAELRAMAERHGWDVDAIAAVMSIESRFQAGIQNPLPGQTASGLIQFTDRTARDLGVPDGAAGIRRMSAVEQLPWVEKYFVRTLGGSKGRPVDYYLAVFQPGLVGAELSRVIASESDARTYNNGQDNVYSLNRGLDTNQNGIITVEDLAVKVANVQARAKGLRIGSSPSALTPVILTASTSGGGAALALLAVAAYALPKLRKAFRS